MPIDSAGWFDWMERVPGPAWKTIGGKNPLLGVAAHSAEGWEAYLRSYQSDQKRRASWHVSNLLTPGKPPMQHYSVYEQTWTSGATWPNSNLIGIESEGVAMTPLNPQQVDNFVHIMEDLREFTGRQTIERIGDRTSVPDGVLIIMEHNEATRFGAASTACPSGRYPWDEIMPRLQQETNELSEAEKSQLRELNAKNRLLWALGDQIRVQALNGDYSKLALHDANLNPLIGPNGQPVVVPTNDPPWWSPNIPGL